MEENERRPAKTILYKDEKEVVVVIRAPGLKPSRSSRDEKDAENGVADVTFTDGGRGMDARIEVKGREIVWRSIVRRFPSRIDTRVSDWIVEENKVVVTLVKAKERGKKGFINWKPLVEANSLDQYREEEDMEKEDVVWDPAMDGFPMTNINIIAIDNNHSRQLVDRQPP